MRMPLKKVNYYYYYYYQVIFPFNLPVHHICAHLAQTQVYEYNFKNVLFCIKFFLG